MWPKIEAAKTYRLEQHQQKSEIVVNNLPDQPISNFVWLVGLGVCETQAIEFIESDHRRKYTNLIK